MLQLDLVIELGSWPAVFSPFNTPLMYERIVVPETVVTMWNQTSGARSLLFPDMMNLGMLPLYCKNLSCPLVPAET